jgi:hypothetical protein
MNVSPSVLLLSIAIGGPLLLLALAVLYHGALVARQRSDLEIALAETGLSPEAGSEMSLASTSASQRAVEAERDLLTEHVASLVTRSADALAERLEEAMAQMQEQLAHQRSSLEMLLSEPARVVAVAPTGRAAGEHIRREQAPPMSAQIARLIEEGLSDRAIARELRIGLEEVKIARSRGSHA